MAKKNKSENMIWVVAITLVVIFVLFMINNYLAGQRYMFQNTIAVINTTTNQIVWIGASQLCVPAAKNTRIVSDCRRTGAGYVCNNTYYNLSTATINCGTVSAPSYSTAQCGSTAALKPVNGNQSYVCASVGLDYRLLWMRKGTVSNFTLDSLGRNSASVTIRGWCGGCFAGADGPPLSSYNYTIILNQTADTVCATGTTLQLIRVTGSYALFLETKFKNQVCY
jgi:hypothetical protein